MFAALPPKPDHDALELAILERWEREAHLRPAAGAERRRPAVQLHRRPGHRQQVARRAHRVGPHAEGRLPALQGAAGATTSATRTASTARASGSRSASRRSSGLNSKREIEEYGLEEFARALPRRRRALVGRAHRRARSASASGWTGATTTSRSPTRTSSTSGGSCKIVHERGWLFRGHRATEWCPRCGTSISAHELVGSYVDREDPALSVRFPLLDRPGEAVVDLDHHAVDAAGQRRRRRPARPPATAGSPTATGSASSGPGDQELVETLLGQRARRLALPRPLRRPRARAARSPTG